MLTVLNLWRMSCCYWMKRMSFILNEYSLFSTTTSFSLFSEIITLSFKSSFKLYVKLCYNLGNYLGCFSLEEVLKPEKFTVELSSDSWESRKEYLRKWGGRCWARVVLSFDFDFKIQKLSRIWSNMNSSWFIHSLFLCFPYSSITSSISIWNFSFNFS